MSFVKDTNHFPSLISGLDQATKKSLEVGVFFLEGQTRSKADELIYNTPASPNYVRTGALKNKIETEPGFGLSVKLVDNVPYGVYVDFGTVKMPARPFFRQAFDENEFEMTLLIARTLGNKILDLI